MDVNYSVDHNQYYSSSINNNGINYNNSSSGSGGGGGGSGSDEETNNNTELMRKGPWTVEEDLTLVNYIAVHGEGRWNSLARCAGLKRTGKSCRLRWLNYLRPDVRRGNITLEEQLLILELHSRWGNRWSKIALYLPGRTDNEIKNYWRTRVQKHAKQLKCDVNSQQFKDTMRYLWMPRLVERIQAASAASSSSPAPPPPATTASLAVSPTSSTTTAYNTHLHQRADHHLVAGYQQYDPNYHQQFPPVMSSYNSNVTPDNSMTTATSPDSLGSQVSPGSDPTAGDGDYGGNNHNVDSANYGFQGDQSQVGGGGDGGGNYHVVDSLTSPCGYFNQGGGCLNFHGVDQSNQWLGGGDISDNLWNVEDVYLLQQVFNGNHVNSNVCF